MSLLSSLKTPKDFFRWEKIIITQILYSIPAYEK